MMLTPDPRRAPAAGPPMDLPELFQTPADVTAFVTRVGLDDGDRATLAGGAALLDQHADTLLGWWLHLAQDGPGRGVLPLTATGDVDLAALTAARPYLRRWMASTSTAAYDARWLDAQRRVATQLGRAPHQRGLGVDGWMALLPFFALVVEGLARILGEDEPVLALQAAWRKAMQIHLTAWVTAAA